MDLAVHDEREQQRYQNVMKNIDSIKKEGTTMSNSNDTNNGQSVWGPAAGAFFGAAFGENGFFGNGGSKNGAGVTTEQLSSGLAQLQGQLQRDGLEAGLAKISGEICGLGNSIGKDIGIATTGLAMGIAGVKDAVVAASAQNALSLCNLGHSMQAGFAATNQAIVMQGAASRELALQQALDAERSKATEYRIALSEGKNAAGHAATQVLLNQVIAKA